MKQKFTFLIIGLILISACTMTEIPETEEIEVIAEFDNKIVYSTVSVENLDPYIQDCQNRGGILNECGSACDLDDGCIQVCALTCEFQ